MPDLLDRYPLTAGTYHELLDDSGAVRPHWRRLFDQLQRSTPAQLVQRQALLARQIQENGVTYNVYADPKGADRPWELDLLPHVIAADEWQQLSAGIAQRARLLNAVLADLVRPAEADQRRFVASRTGIWSQQFSLAVSGYFAAGRRLSAPVCRGSGAHPGRALVGDGRSHSGAIGCRAMRWKTAPSCRGPFPSCTAI
jgi:uncharacterized circularly permuted ATP-grasp superfamily protein